MKTQLQYERHPRELVRRGGCGHPMIMATRSLTGSFPIGVGNDGAFKDGLFLNKR